ncbi:hypothetical protein D1AOALGA4SA_7554 [Olavius algarvensis Delta 1 endosymbiont]|nr:hypothetical protein D1AOALGA4SA_7554 [Olavius algarvensis Delta 1 endosymbiont]
MSQIRALLDFVALNPTYISFCRWYFVVRNPTTADIEI